MVKFTVPGEPKGKGRPRVFRDKGGNSRAITPKDTVVYENLVKMSYQGPLLEGELIAEIKAYYSIPKSISKKKKQQMLSGEICPTKKPDLDNIVKVILDSLNHIAYKDDSQVVKVIAEKYYSDSPRVDVTLYRREL